MTAKKRGRPRGRKGQAAALDAVQIKQVLKTARASGRFADRAEVAIRLGLDLGLRVGEMCKLTWADLLDERGRLRERITVPDVHEKSFPLHHSTIRQLLTNYREKTEILHGSLNQLPLFPSTRGKHFTAPSMTRFLNDLYRRAEITAGSSRSGRRTFKTGIK